jgi:aspartate-semialdehyde dehydrogenase
MRICILGATGLVGLELIDLIPQLWPKATVLLFGSKDQDLEWGGKTYAVKGAAFIESADMPRGDLAFVALDDQHSARYVPRLLDLGYRVIDKSNTYRADPNVPLVVAGVNGDKVNQDTKLVANPNCTTIPLTLALKALSKLSPLRSLAVSTYQAVSGAGKAALDEFLANAAMGYTAAMDGSFRDGSSFQVSGYAGNTVPHNGGTDDSGYSSEERKLMFETKKILDLPDFPVSVQCCRVPVAVGHYENVWLEFAEPVEIKDMEKALQKAPWVRYFPGAAGEGLTALTTGQNRDHALVGRIRKDLRDRSGRTVCLTVVGDNLRVGAATNAVRVACRWFPPEGEAKAGRKAEAVA